MGDEQIELRTRLPRDWEQMRRARVLLDASAKADQPDTRFVLLVGALHLSRAVPEYWYTIAEQMPTRLNKEGKEASELAKRLLEEFEEVFQTARRYALLTDLRRWDFHWEPLIDPATVAPNCTYGRGAPVRLSTGPTPNSSVSFFAGNQLVTTASGRRIGRTNYYQIQQCRYVDFERSEALPLDLALGEFLEDLPGCILRILEKVEVIEYLKTL
jgi:hypothetical protein